MEELPLIGDDKKYSIRQKGLAIVLILLGFLVSYVAQEWSGFVFCILIGGCLFFEKHKCLGYSNEGGLDEYEKTI